MPFQKFARTLYKTKLDTIEVFETVHIFHRDAYFFIRKFLLVKFNVFI